MKKLLVLFMLLFCGNAFAADTAILQSANGTAISSSNPLPVTFGDGAQVMSGAFWEHIRGSNVNRYMDFNDNPFATTIGGGLYLRYSNIWFLEEGEDLDVIVTSEEIADGDTLNLGSGTYTITADIDVTKALKIRGQGINKTIISCTGTTNCFEITKDGTEISDLSIVTSGAGTQIGVLVTGTAGTRFTNVLFSNLLITQTGTGIKRGLSITDSGVTLRNVWANVTSSDNEASGFRVGQASTMEGAVTMNAYNSGAIVSSGGAQGYAWRLNESTATQITTINLYDCYGFATEGASSTSAGIFANAVTSPEIVVNLYGGAYSGTDNAAEITGTAVVNYYNTNLVGSVSGTITPLGTLYANNLNLGGTMTSSLTTSLGWSVVDQTDNQACTTGCTSACVFGIDNATGTAVTNLVSCAATTADLCVCAGSS